MSKFLDRYKTDRKAEEGGQWVDFGDGLRVCLRRLNSQKSKEVRRKLEKPYANLYRGGREMPDSLQEELMNKQLAEAIIVDWEGVPELNEKGDPIEDKAMPCTPENVIRMVSQFPDFREDIVTASLERATFQVEERKDNEGNSGSALNGS
jgi:hypothetical protein